MQRSLSPLLLRSPHLHLCLHWRRPLFRHRQQASRRRQVGLISYSHATRWASILTSPLMTAASPRSLASTNPLNPLSLSFRIFPPVPPPCPHICRLFSTPSLNPFSLAVFH